MAKLLYLPFSIVASLIAGKLSQRVFDRVWAAVDDGDPPGADDPEATVGRVITAAAVQAAVFATVKALFDNGARRFFRYLVGAWPGGRKPA